MWISMRGGSKTVAFWHAESRMAGFRPAVCPLWKWVILAMLGHEKGD
jgi:hypothetical protein